MQLRLGTQLRAERFYDDHMLDHLNERMRDFVQRQEMFFLATADRNGECDSSFRAGPPGFLHVLDAHTLAYPEYRGNGVLASLGNIRENPQLGILLMDFLHARIGLHINGRATLVEDAELRLAHPYLPLDPVPGRRPLLWVQVEVQEAYIHCAKHIPHLHKAPGHSERDWGTDDYKRKGGDFFGVAREARQRRRAVEDVRDAPVVPGQRSTPAAVAATPVASEPLLSDPFSTEPLPSAPPRALSRPPRGPEGGRAEGTSVGEPEETESPADAPPPARRAAALADQADSAVWLEEARRALDEARRRGRAQHPSPSFQGWFS